MLMRADSATYAPSLLAVVRDPAEQDVHARIKLAQVLDLAGFKEGTEYLMEAVRQRGKGMGLEIGVATIVAEYPAFRMRRALAEEDLKRMQPERR